MSGWWIDAIGAGPRRALLAGTAAALVLGTASSALPEGAALHDGIALIVVLGLAAAWWLAWARLGRPAVEAQQAALQADEARRQRDRGLVVSAVAPPVRTGLDALRERDPGFSLPVLSDVIRALHRSTAATPGAPPEPNRWVHGPVRVVAVAVGAERTTLDAVVQALAPDGTALCRRLRLSRPNGAASPVPGGADGGWRLDSAVPAERPAPVAVAPDPRLPAALRALSQRDEALDRAALEALVEAVDAAVDSGDVEPYATSGGLECVIWWRAQQGLPPSGPSEWLSVDEDGWTERIEVRRGKRILGLMRPSARPEAAWRLWRLREAR
ncbi:MAG: hypothetical protein R3F59_12575 [Myxococcota bacterium]